MTGKSKVEVYFTSINAGASHAYVYLDIYRDGTRVARKTVANKQETGGIWSGIDISALPSGNYKVLINVYFHTTDYHAVVNATFNKVRCV